MLLATILLLFPLPQTGNTVQAATDAPATVLSDSTQVSSLAQPLLLLSMPAPKVEPDAEAATHGSILGAGAGSSRGVPAGAGGAATLRACVAGAGEVCQHPGTR